MNNKNVVVSARTESKHEGHKNTKRKKEFRGKKKTK